MATSINWGTKVITVPRADMTLIQSVPTEIRTLSLDAFRRGLKDLEDGAEGMSFLDTHKHNTTVSVGGVDLARVIEIINGYTVTFEDGAYAVTLLGANSNVGDVVNVNQVSVRSSNSAGLVTSTAIEFGEYGGGVTLDAINGIDGTIYPTGTPRQPSNNLTDALTIATARGFSQINIRGDFTFAVSDVVNGFKFIGESPTKTLLTLTEAASITSCVFENLTAVGTLDGGCDLFECHITTLNYVDGSVRECQLNAGVMTLSGTQAELVRCWSGVAGTSTPEVNMGGTGTDLLVRDYQGGIELSNYTSGVNNVSIDMASGHIKLASSIISGAFLIRGIGKLTDLSIGAAVNSDDLINKALLTEITNLVTDLREENPTTQEIAKKVWEADLIDVDEEESAGYMLFNTAEIVEQNLVTPEQLANAVWSKDMTEAFGLNTAGGLLKKIKLIYTVLLS